MRPMNPRWGHPHLAAAVRAFEIPTCGRADYARLEPLGYVASSGAPRAGGVVRLELKELCTSASRLARAKARGRRWDAFTVVNTPLRAVTWRC